MQTQLTDLQQQLTAVEAGRVTQRVVIAEQAHRLEELRTERDTLRAQRDDARWRTATLAMRLQRVERVLHAIQRGRLYRGLRRFGRWAWVEQMLTPEPDPLPPTTPAASTSTPPLSVSSPEAPASSPVVTQQSAFELSHARIRDPKKSGGVWYPPGSEDRIRQRLQDLGVAVHDYAIDLAEYHRYVAEARYRGEFSTYYATNQPEKALEHYVAARLLQLDAQDIYIDIASEHSPVPDIYHRLFGVTTYRQDLAYPAGLNGDTIGGDAARMPVPDGFATKMALHCSFEHFEGTSDIDFLREAARVLLPGGAVCIVPLYLSEEYAIQTDPEVAIPADMHFEDDAVVYCAPGWGNRHGRFYDPEHCVSRVLATVNGWGVTLYRLTNTQEVDPSCYARFALLLRKP